MNLIEQRLATQGFYLPEAASPVAHYIPYTQHLGVVFISGQISKINETEITGRLGDNLTLEQGKKAAQLCALNLIAHMKKACKGDLTRVRKVIKLGGFVQALPIATQTEIPYIINGASELMTLAFGDNGRHARFAVSAPSLPLDMAVEIDAIVEINPSETS